MDRSDYSVLVGRLERAADDHPRVYAARVACVAALGYALPIAVCLTILIACYSLASALISGGHVSLLVAFGLFASVGSLIVLLRALNVRIDLPTGRSITREEAPDLFAMIDDVVERMAWKRGNTVRRVPITSVKFDNELNLSISQVPRWGVFGGYTNHLQLGVPLLALLDLAELKTVLAHEIGHLGGRHGRFGAWIYRQRQTWQVLQRKFDAPATLIDRVLGVFYCWYAPYLFAHALVLSRAHEYHADQVAALATNARVLARALVKVTLAKRFLEEIFWPRFFAQVEKVAAPPYAPFSMLPRALTLAHKEWLRDDWMQASLRRFADEDDTHPGLRERLAALDVQPELPTQMQGKEALMQFGELGPALLKWCDEEWQRDNAVAWRRRHEAIKEARWKIAQYENTAAAELKPDDLWQKSLLLIDVGQEADALEELRALVTLDPSIAKAQFLLGRLLLGNGDEAGLQNLAQAAHGDAELTDAAGQLGYEYLMTRGRKREAQRFWDRVQAA